MKKRWTLEPIVILAMFAFINPFNPFRWIETDGLCVDCLERGSWQAVTSGFELSAGAKFKFKIAPKFSNLNGKQGCWSQDDPWEENIWNIWLSTSLIWQQILSPFFRPLFCVHIIGEKFDPPTIFGLLRFWYFVKKCWTVVTMWPIQSRQIVET